MEILSVTLKNFKSHSERQFNFQPGTNAICGENGAGKTSILEAIAWVLFNHRGAYKNEDLIRNGNSSAQVMVSLISGRDGRTYEIQRCTTKGYSILDPQLGVKLDYHHIEDEIMPWLRQQLGVAPGTDLARLFANTIGVPQGTFTADFLQPSEKRKQIFDAILKVEEYRQTNHQLLSLEKYSKTEVESISQTISQYEEMLAGRELLETRHQTLCQEIAQNEATLAQLQISLSVLSTEKANLSQQAEQMQALTGRFSQLQVQRDGKQQSVALLQQNLERSQQAVNACLANRDSYRAYLQAEATLKQLDPQLKQRQALWQQREQQQQQHSQQQQQATRLSLQLEALDNAALQMQQMQPLIAQQTELERRQAELTEQLNQLQLLKREQQSLSQQLSQSQQQQAELQQALAQIPAHQAAISQLPALEQKRERIQEQLSRMEAAQQFEAELRQLVTLGESRHDQYETQAEEALALLQAALQASGTFANAPVESVIVALQSGIDLNSDLINALWRVLADLSEQTSPQRLQLQLQQLKTQIEATQQQRQQLARLEAQQGQQQQGQELMLPLQDRIAQIQQQLATEAVQQQQRTSLQQQLSSLNNPKGRYQLLERDLQQRDSLNAQQTRLSKQQISIQQALVDLETQLAAFANLEAELEQQQALRQSHQAGYQTYLEYQQEANQHAPLKADLQAQIQQLQQIEADLLAAEQAQQELAQTYDPERFQAVEAEWLATRSQADQITGSLPQQQKLLSELDSQRAQMQSVAKKHERAQVELKQADKLRKFISFARKAFKEAGPRITERYVQTVSREADRLFRELLNRSNVALEWTRDYEIIVQEGAYSRRLLNLSGGEQMCAALAVRLALLRVLADIDIAFFDEPTTNMDRQRRQSLAEAIANIKTFRQLFVISHDDTFEQVTENVILVEREL
ncbi:MAG: SMC family ATPase [Pegethrix bostrychoides GSE-TBD4-15B]|jgi:exonuclease SbcC|uniref:Nuclease SbcCD subunit C n=1 Tax=Pegethrix bostrychoides GSE-TBD4-15B TaxID=2839662 RepID=A0A951PD59_9CYAN|nr:SMC family ATPase [Pegethrix bostrychoides GSE-TBD4-15B]